ncbi:MAG: uroporphyrinogen-III synthase [Pseudolabrys sp.]
MRVVVTRPEPQSEQTAAALRARGHDVLLGPLMKVEPIVADLSGPWGGVVITSANALAAIAGDSVRDALLALPLFAVGRRSAAVARAAGFTDVTSAGGDVRDLVQLFENYLAGARAAGIAEAALAVRHYCLSAQVAAPLQAAGAGRVAVAPQPQEAALIELLPLSPG